MNSENRKLISQQYVCNHTVVVCSYLKFLHISWFQGINFKQMLICPIAEWLWKPKQTVAIHLNLLGFIQNRYLPIRISKFFPNQIYIFDDQGRNEHDLLKTLPYNEIMISLYHWVNYLLHEVMIDYIWFKTILRSLR